jgi:translocator assembly and maintenance protein 41
MTPGKDAGQLTPVEELREIIETTFPTDKIVYAFGYGSGVLSQQLANAEGDAETKVIDLILAVEDTRAFHRENLQVNPSHYAVPAWFGKEHAADIVTWLQRHAVDNTLFRNPKVYFNVTDRIKYGVVQVEDLSADLTDWKYLYLAGRMHKPVVTIIDRQTPCALDSIQYQQDNHNLPAGLSAALLLQFLTHHQQQKEHALDPSSSVGVTLSEASVYQQIASLSYTGDLRMAVGAEDPLKISKLVESPGQLQRFRDLYAASADNLCQAGLLSIDSQNQTWTWNASSPTARAHLWRALPPNLSRLGDNDSGNQDSKDASSACFALAAALPAIVAPAARYQSFKGLFTAGASKSFKYAVRKLSKGLTSKSKVKK